MAKRAPPVLLALALGAAAALPRCACDTVPAEAVERCNVSQVFAGRVKTDILFVIDDSGSMSEEQDNLSANLGAFIDRLASLPIDDDYQIAVTTTDVDSYAGGTSFSLGPSGGRPYPAGALVAVAQDGAGAGRRGDLVYDATAYPATNGWGGARILARGSPTLVRDFRANVLVGVSGSGKEQPFRAARLALTDRIQDGTNAGFLRPGARLAVVFASDEDDCSDSPPRDVSTNGDTGNAQCHASDVKQTLLDPVAELAAFLQGPIQGEVRDTIVAGIVGVAPGTLDPACATTEVCGAPPASCAGACCATAYDRADRHAALLSAMGARSRLASICDASFAAALEDFATAIMSDTLPLDGTPADWRMLVASVSKAGAAAIACPIAHLEDSSPEQRAAAGAIYAPPREGRPASLTFQGACALAPGDRIDVGVVCAG